MLWELDLLEKWMIKFKNRLNIILKTTILTFLFVTFFSCDQKKSPNLDQYIELGYDQIQLDNAVQSLGQIEQFRSVAISYKGQLIVDEYFHDETAEPHQILDVRSVTKSITSLLTGIAIDQGFIISVDQKLSDFISSDIAEMNEQFSNLTLKQLLNMQAGFEWHEITEPSEFGEWITAPDQLEYILNKPFINNPGEVFDYSDGAAHLMSIVIEEATGQPTLAFAQKYLFDPLNIGKREWYQDNRGYYYGGVGVILTTLDMIKIGELVLDRGMYNNNRVVSADWIDTSISPQVMTNIGDSRGSHYGYYWWLGTKDGYSFYYANGYGGQFIFINEDSNLIIATLCDFLTYGNASWEKIMITITNKLLPAFEPL